MAYAASGLALVSNAGAHSIWLYRTADNINTVMGSAYFVSAANSRMFNVGDQMIIRSGYGGTEVDFTAICTNATTPVFALMGQQGGLLSAKLAIAVTAVTNTDFTLVLPPCTLLRATTRTSTAFGAVTDAQISVGTSAAGSAELVAAVSVKAAGTVAHTVIAAASVFAGGTVYVRIAQSGGNSATGAATLVLEYAPN